MKLDAPAAPQTAPAPPQTAPAAAEPSLSPEQTERFLATAEIKSGRLIGKGVTSPWRLTLSDGVVTHDAAFQAVDRERDNVRFKGGREEKNFRDYYGYNIAAYRLARVLGYDDLVPVSIERTWQGKKGALTWWVNKKWDEDERLKQKVVAARSRRLGAPDLSRAHLHGPRRRHRPQSRQPARDQGFSPLDD